MGATTAQKILVGRDLNTAYGEAVREATMMHGHNPYNGTISTSHGVREIADVSTLLGRVKLGKFITVVWELSYADSDPDAKPLKHLRTLPDRLQGPAKRIATMVSESKFGVWPAILCNARDAKGLRPDRKRGEKVWIALGWAAE